jgi:hypothetical protein
MLALADENQALVLLSAATCKLGALCFTGQRLIAGNTCFCYVHAIIPSGRRLPVASSHESTACLHVGPARVWFSLILDQSIFTLPLPGFFSCCISQGGRRAVGSL